MEASRIRGFGTTVELETADLILVTQDVDSHDHLHAVDERLRYALNAAQGKPVVLVSQVPPGYTRPWSRNRGNLYYQVDTIIMNRALQRATFPERLIVGCEYPDKPLPDVYWEYLGAFGCPILKMSYESAELTKLAINYYLAKQVEATAELARVAEAVGADWSAMVEAISLDKRIGSYLKPGVVGGHLPRDVHTIERILRDTNDTARTA